MNTVIKKLLGIITVVAIVAAAGWNFSQSQNEVEMSDLALANVEALARGEGGNGSMNQEYICRKCGAEFEGCFWCTEDPNYCNCTASGHSC